MKLETAKGVRDFGPEQKILRNKIVENLTQVFELYGFSPFETPIIERAEVLTAKGGAGEESDVIKETFQLTDRGERKLGLRFELTLSLARYIGMTPDLKMPFKRYELGPVFRDGPIKLGRYRQFWQCDVDAIGSKDMMADAEIIMLALDCFKKLGLDAYLEVNNRKLMRGILEYAGISKKQANSVIITIDKLEKFGKAEVVKELKQKGVKPEQIDLLFKAFGLTGTNLEKLERLSKLIDNEIGKQGLFELQEIFSYVDTNQLVLNLSLARGLAYYTGPVFEGFMRNSKVKSSICGGGRYDNMIGSLLGKEEIPAVGISFGLDVIGEIVKPIAEKTVADIYIIPIRTAKQAMKICQKLRSNNIKADIDIGSRGISKNLAYANVLKIPYVLFIGEQELLQKKVKLRDMSSGKENLMGVDELITMLKGVFNP